MANLVALRKIQNEVNQAELNTKAKINNTDSIDWDKYYAHARLRRFLGIGVESEDESK